MNGIEAFTRMLRRAPKPCPPGEDTTRRCPPQMGGGCSPTQPSGALISDFPASRAVSNKFLLLVSRPNKLRWGLVSVHHVEADSDSCMREFRGDVSLSVLSGPPVEVRGSPWVLGPL